MIFIIFIIIILSTGFRYTCNENFRT